MLGVGQLLLHLLLELLNLLLQLLFLLQDLLHSLLQLLMLLVMSCCLLGQNGLLQLLQLRHVLLKSSQLLLVGEGVLLQGREGGLVLLL